MAFKLGMTVDLCMAYMLMLVSMTLTLMQGHSWSAKVKISFDLSWQLSIRVGTTVGLFFLTWPWLSKCLLGLTTLFNLLQWSVANIVSNGATLIWPLQLTGNKKNENTQEGIKSQVSIKWPMKWPIIFTYSTPVSRSQCHQKCQKYITSITCVWQSWEIIDIFLDFS